jgi:hypothetical protein
LGRIRRSKLAVDDGVQNRGAERTADGASGECKAGRGGKEGMWSGELDKGDQEGEGPGLADAGEDVEANLGVVHAGCDDRVADGSVGVIGQCRDPYAARLIGDTGRDKTYTTRNTRNVNINGDLRSLNLVA